MIAIQKLDMEDIIFICRLIGLEEINSFMKKNHISSRMVTGKTMLGYSQKGSAPFPMSFAVMYDRSRSDKQVITFLEDKIQSIVSEIKNTIKDKAGSTSEIYFLLISEINNKFNGNETLFCKIEEVENLMEYITKLKGTTNMQLVEIMKFPVQNLNENDFEQLVNIIGADTLGKIIPGMWLNTHSVSEVKEYLYNHKQEKKIQEFIKIKVEKVLKKIAISFKNYYQANKGIEDATVLALNESNFKLNPNLYFKITKQNSSKRILSKLNAINELQSTQSEFLNHNESEKVKKMEKIISDLEDEIIILKNQKEKESKQLQSKIELLLQLKSHVDDSLIEAKEEIKKLKTELINQIENNKLADLENSKKEADEALIAAEAEIASLLKANKEYEEKAAANDDSSMLLSEKESLISEIKHLENRKTELSDDVKKIEEIKAQLTSQKNLLQSQLEQEIKRFSNDFVHSTAVSAILQQFTSLQSNSSQNNSIYIEMPPCDITDISHEDSISSITDILASNLFSIGIQKRKKEISQIIISAILSKAGLIIYGSGSNDIADALSLALFAEYAAHIVLPTDISNIPYFLNEINKIDRNVVYIENALDSFTDILCSSILRHCNDKIFIFAVNSYDSLKALKKSSVFEKSLFLNTEYLLDYIPNHNYKANICNLSFENDIKGTMPAILGNASVKNMIKMTNIPPSIYRFWIYITAVFGSKYNIKFRNSIILEYTIYLMMNDGLCDGSVKELYNYINENEDYKLDRLNDLLPEEETNESNNKNNR